jgi:hypothetical protein
MEKIINSALYNTSTANLICTQHSNNEKGIYVKQTTEIN